MASKGTTQETAKDERDNANSEEKTVPVDDDATKEVKKSQSPKGVIKKKISIPSAFSNSSASKPTVKSQTIKVSKEEATNEGAVVAPKPLKKVNKKPASFHMSMW